MFGRVKVLESKDVAQGGKEIPVTIVTGFLGSGKTTLLNRMLTESHGKKIAVVLNEIGEVNLDSELVVQTLGEELKVMNNGCLCCTVRGDLTKVAKDLLKKNLDFDHLVIETTGMADPSPVAQTFFMDEELQRHYFLDAILTVVDGFHIEKNLKTVRETQDQIGFADIIILNKTDLIEEAKIGEVEKIIRGINGVAKLVKTQKCAVPVSEVLGIAAFDLQDRVKIDPSIMAEYHDHTHDDEIQSIYIEEKRPLDLEKLNKFMALIVNELGEQVLRSKGVLNIQDNPLRVVFQGVHMTVGSSPDREWAAGEERKTQMVFIGRHLPRDVLAEGLSMCVAQG
ncbi:MAG: GTP-binding protein [Proteobacteria bacterium]|nr:GTP-binding protein [Pseudomonadota bacterium]